MLTVHIENGRISLREVPRPSRPPGYSLIRLIAAGICNTDLELQRGYYGFAGTPGHEFVGEVLESDSALLRGQRVVGEINLACGICEWCSKGLRRHCPTRTVLGIVNHPGAFAEFLTLPDVNLHPLPSTLADHQAIFVEPLAAACEILDQVSIPPGTQVALLGDGKLGLLIAQVLRANGIEVCHFGHHRAAQFDPGHLPVRAFEYVIDATGSAEGLAQAVEITQPRGTVILKSTVHGMVPVDTAAIIVQELTLIGSRCGRFEPALHLLAQNQVQTSHMISEVVPLSRAAEAFTHAAKKGILKVILSNP